MCWGGRYAIRAGLGSNAIETDEGMKPLVDAVVALHPSNLVLLDDVRDVVVPVSIGWGVRDSIVSYKMEGQVRGSIRKKGRRARACRISNIRRIHLADMDSVYVGTQMIQRRESAWKNL